MKKILMSVLVIALVASVAAVGASGAYFSSTETVPVTSEAGTMNLQVSKSADCSVWHDGDTMSWSTPSAWAPGDTDTILLCLKNTGTSGALMFKAGGDNLGGTGGLVDVIHITAIDATEFNDTVWMGVPMSAWMSFGMDANDDDVVTLREFVEWPYSCMFWEGSHPPTTDYLDAGGGDVKKFKIELTFDPNAGNEYQGTTASFDLNLTITDDPTILGEG